MEAVIFVGAQASGKSSFYKERFFATHVRVNLDMLRTRHRERRLLEFCFETRMRFVVDNTNPTRRERARYVAPAREAGFRVIGYGFRSAVEDCVRRNEGRAAGHRVPLVGVLATHAKLEVPSFEEGFDELRYVRIGEEGGFVVEEWVRQGGV